MSLNESLSLRTVLRASFVAGSFSSPFLQMGNRSGATILTMASKQVSVRLIDSAELSLMLLRQRRSSSALINTSGVLSMPDGRCAFGRGEL